MPVVRGISLPLLIKSRAQVLFNISPTAKIIRGWDGPRREKTCLRGFANNTGADQPAHSRSLISAFVIHFLESTVH